MVVMHFVLIIA